SVRQVTHAPADQTALDTQQPEVGGADEAAPAPTGAEEDLVVQEEGLDPDHRSAPPPSIRRGFALFDYHPLPSSPSRGRPSTSAKSASSTARRCSSATASARR